MSSNQLPSIFRDGSGNIRETAVDFGAFLGDRTANVSTATGSAAAIYCTLPGQTGKRWVLDSAKLCIASIAANTAVAVTTVDGTTAANAHVFSANGAYELAPGAGNVDDKLKLVTASGAALAVQVASGGTASTTTLNLVAHLVTAADV